MGLTPYFHDDHLTVYQGDCREVMAAMEPESVHCVVTSPPYWGLRDYGTATWVGGEEGCDHVEPRGTILGKRSATFHGSNTQAAHEGRYKVACAKCGAVRQDSQLGLEPTPEAFVANMVDVFREVRRVLRKDGTLWLNLGDSYHHTAGGYNPDAPSNQPGHYDGDPRGNAGSRFEGGNERGLSGRRYPGPLAGLKPKDLVGIPWRVAFALQADGWYLRSDIIWSKPNPMPESVTDRPTKAHEYLFLLTKSARYYYDADAVRESVDSHPSGNGFVRPERISGGLAAGDATDWQPTGGRNLRTVWTIATAPYPGAHFATFPRKLVEPCVKAGTSERGVCSECGAPWTREVEQGELIVNGHTAAKPPKYDERRREDFGSNAFHTGMQPGMARERSTTGWRPSCDHSEPKMKGGNEAYQTLPRGSSRVREGAPAIEGTAVADAEPVAATVLDPFAGSGTTGLVAQALGRRAVLIDLNGEYLVQAMARNAQTPLGLVG